MTIETLLSMLQFSDGLFPAGAYAHSFGLETYSQDGRVSNAANVRQLLRAYLEGGAGPCDAVVVTNALRAAIASDLDACRELDLMLDAIKTAAEPREASRQLGRQTLRIAATLIDHPVMSGLARAAGCGETPCHHAVVFGVIGGAYGWEPEAAAAAFLYASAAAMAGAATRLIPLGQTQAQRLISEATPLITALARAAAERTTSEIFTFAPALEIAAMRHAQLEARLFRS
ncbi:MAG: urease accessory UreF family protein [Candidatus Binataceae bacterium]|jgi:urease accessory protein